MLKIFSRNGHSMVLAAISLRCDQSEYVRSLNVVFLDRLALAEKKNMWIVLNAASRHMSQCGLCSENRHYEVTLDILLALFERFVMRPNTNHRMDQCQMNDLVRSHTFVKWPYLKEVLPPSWRKSMAGYQNAVYTVYIYIYIFWHWKLRYENTSIQNSV